MPRGYLLCDEDGFPMAAVAVLATVPGVNAKVQAATSLLTVPTGRSICILDIIPRATAVDTVLVPPILQVGVSPSYNEWLGTATLTGLTAAGQSFSLAQFIGTSPGRVFTSGQTVAVNITTGATATTLTLAYDVIGYCVS